MQNFTQYTCSTCSSPHLLVNEFCSDGSLKLTCLVCGISGNSHSDLFVSVKPKPELKLIIDPYDAIPF